MVNRSNILEKEPFKNFTGHLFKREAYIPAAVEKRSRARITEIRSESIIFKFAQAQRKWASLSLQKLNLPTKTKLVNTEKLGVNAYFIHTKIMLCKH